MNSSKRDSSRPDVLIIGGGPAGATAAAFLAMKGRHAVLVEKEAHPRFHIGESLLPRNIDIFERLGVLDQVREIGVHKPGAEFVSDRTGRSCAFPFRNALNPNRTHAWQVRRADLDALLFKQAIARGAECFERTRVTEVKLDDAGGRHVVSAKDHSGNKLEWHPRYVLDASGRDTFLASRMKVKTTNKYNNTAAVYAHFTGVTPREGELAGYISIHLAEDGWFWLIPLPDDTMSIGFVGNQSAWKGRTGTPADLLTERLAASPTVAARMQGAQRISDVYSTANYSYRAREGNGNGFLMIGDAYGFVDPMFSTGVLMAMMGGELGAEVAHVWLDDPARGMKLAQAANEDLSKAMDRISWLIYRVNDPVMRTLFMEPSNRFWMRDGLVSLLAGNLQGSWRAALPVLCFKSVYHVLSALHRRGIELSLPEMPAPGT
ncbi:MAG: tryptophan 7-halogenase [Paraburkholderia sp.]|jgi:flavin-dependent dehydrogenase|nr:tryptophan 7-halogenase [Paraburkholderia sp.]